MKLRPVLLLPLVLPLAAGDTLEQCTTCLALLPEVGACVFDPERCDLSSCDFTDLENCDCLNCITPVLECIDGCIPECLDEDAIALATCVSNPTCYEGCSGTFTGTVTITIPPLIATPTECDWNDLFTDFTSCLPTWPTCAEVQSNVVPTVCDVTSCCSTCHDEILDLASCFYGWLSGDDCRETFSCSAARSLGMSQGAPASEYYTKRKLQGEEPPEYVKECHDKLTTNLILQPDASFNIYMDCIVSNSMELAVDESNKPPPTNPPTTSSSAFHNTVAGMVVPVAAVAWIFL